MKYVLKLDYDHHRILGEFSRAVHRFKYVYRFKRTYKVRMRVVQCERTKKGYHVTMVLKDKEKWDTWRERALALLNYQVCFGSDVTRSVFDTLRVAHGDRVYNLLFNMKNDFECKVDRAMLLKLNLCLMKRGVFLE